MLWFVCICGLICPQFPIEGDGVGLGGSCAVVSTICVLESFRMQSQISLLPLYFSIFRHPSNNQECFWEVDLDFFLCMHVPLGCDNCTALVQEQWKPKKKVIVLMGD